MDSERDRGTALGRMTGKRPQLPNGRQYPPKHFEHVAPDDEEVGELLLHPANLAIMCA